MNTHRNRSGFTLIELMIVVAIIAAVSAMAVPKLLRAKLSANEAAAISTLRLLSSVQAQVRSLGSIDTDADGTGEYAYFGELAGTAPMRIATGGGPGAGTPGIDELDPSVITDAFGVLDANGYATRSGYHFQMWLPGPTAGATPGYPEAPGGGGVGAGGGAPGPAGFPDPDNAENQWCCYAWPVRADSTGNRAFFVNDEGLIYQCQNRGATPFSGTGNSPGFGEAYVDPADISSGVRIGTAGGNANTVWAPVQ